MFLNPVTEFTLNPAAAPWNPVFLEIQWMILGKIWKISFDSKGDSQVYLNPMSWHALLHGPYWCRWVVEHWVCPEICSCTCSEKLRDILKFWEFWGKYRGDAWNLFRWVWNQRAGGCQANQRSSSSKFLNVYFAHMYSILIVGGRNQVKVIKGSQVQIFQNVYFWTPMHRKCI